MTLNYIGSKKSLLDFIDIPLSKIIKSKNIKMLDGFAGTGIVGYFFNKKYNINIVSNDMEYYSYIINYGLLNVKYSNKLKKIILEINQDIINDIDHNNDNYNLISNNYTPKGQIKRKYWTEQNGKYCDYIKYKIDKLLLEKKINNDEHIFLNASLLISMDKVANTACVYGAFLKNFKKNSLLKLVLYPLHTDKKKSNNNMIYNKDINSNEIYDNEYDIVYLDPPYNERQYSSNYHPLNYIAKYDKNLEIYGKTGLIKDYNKSKFCGKDAYNSLVDIINKLKTKHILLSYNNEGIINFDSLINFLKEKGKVILYKKVYKKFKSNINQNNANVYEYLFHIEINDQKSYNEIIID